MSKLFFDELDIPMPDYHLGIGSGRHGIQTGRMLEAIEKVLLERKPDWVVVYGDTNSTLAGALAAVKLHIPVAHVEAGLRSFNRRMPEEINRVLTDHASDRLFAPTATAKQNLEREGLPSSKVYRVGDVMYDAALFYAGKAESESQILRRLGLKAADYVLATIHRAENTDDPVRLKAIFDGFSSVASEIRVVVPLHPVLRLPSLDKPWIRRGANLWPKARDFSPLATLGKGDYRRMCYELVRTPCRKSAASPLEKGDKCTNS